MLGLILRFVLVVLVFRVLGGLLRAIAGSAPSPPRMPERKPPKPIVDRSRAIDVPFTEEPRES